MYSLKWSSARGATKDERRRNSTINLVRKIQICNDPLPAAVRCRRNVRIFTLVATCCRNPVSYIHPGRKFFNFPRIPEILELRDMFAKVPAEQRVSRTIVSKIKMEKLARCRSLTSVQGWIFVRVVSTCRLQN